jgi:predicted HTH domain antitoxin
MTITLSLELPEALDYDEWDVKMFLASRLYAEAKLTSGQAAQLVGISKREFLETVGQYGVSVFGQTTIEEVLSDMANA